MHWDGELEDHDEMEEHIWKSERVQLTSIGIDIGSSTSHLILSSLVLHRRGKEYYSGYTVVSREIIYQSPIWLTPYLPNENYNIDERKLGELIAAAYQDAGITPDQIDSGAVITTGEAARKENAGKIIDLFAAQAGKFVCATAGHTLEAVLAAHGSGAVRMSLEHHGADQHHPVTMNVDIGGGTTKIAIVQVGKVIETSVINVGSRLVAWDEQGRLIRVEQAAAVIANHLGFNLEVGRVITAEQRVKLAQQLTRVLFNSLQRETLSPLSKLLLVTAPLQYSGPIDYLTYSGGVSEYIYTQEQNSFGDLGALLGGYIQEASAGLELKLQQPRQGIRATVIGASQYTVQVSGNTIFISDMNILPLHNLPVITVDASKLPLQADNIAAQVTSGVTLLAMDQGDQPLAVAVRWRQEPSYQVIAEFCRGLVKGLHRQIARQQPLIIIFDQDVANLAGQELLSQLNGNTEIICVDSINLKALNYVDIGKQLPDTKAVPVTVKSLIFT